MKTVALTSSSSSATSDGGDRSDTSCYFPGCRKDANCTCDICLASINATLDLVPSATRSIIANPIPQKSPIPFDSRVLSTPVSRYPRPVSRNPKPVSAPEFDSTARARNRGGVGIGGFLIRLILGVGLVFGVELGFSWGVSRVLKPELSAETVRNVVEESWVLRDFDGKLGFLQGELRGLVNGEVSDCGSNGSLWKINQRELQGLVNGEVCDCGSNGSLWKINQDDLLLNSQCTLYKSATEEVSLWGWPLQTAGLLTAGFSSRSFTILSGRVTEWSNGKASNLTVKTNQSWVHKRWSASAVQFDKNTWIVEYKRAQMIENTSLISAALEFLNFRLTKTISKIKQDFWFLPNFGSQYSSINGDNFKVPT